MFRLEEIWFVYLCVDAEIRVQGCQLNVLWYFPAPEARRVFLYFVHMEELHRDIKGGKLVTNQDFSELRDVT